MLVFLHIYLCSIPLVMGNLNDPKIWVPLPYMNPRDCSKWCFHLFPPPPPSSSFSFPLDTSSSGPTFSPLVITIIGVLVSAFLLVSYYLILTKYCGNSEHSRRRVQEEDDHDHDHDDDHDHDTLHEPWVISTIGLDEALIKSITLVNGGSLSGDCSVCLGEFQEDDSLRLLPKCSHAFHVDCIDTWLRSHSNCPLCRANIFSSTTQPPPPPPVVVHINHEPPPPPPLQTQVANGDGRLLGGQDGNMMMMMRMSVSMDHCHETEISISDILRFELKKEDAGGSSNEISGNGVFCSVVNSMAIKRSFSSGRLSMFTKHGRGRNATIIPM